MPICTNLLRHALPTAAVAGGAFLLMTGCTQPKINCMSAHGDFAAVYKLESGDPNSPCGQLQGDRLGMQSYSQEGGLNGTPDYNKSIVAIRPAALGGLLIRAMSTAEEGGAALNSDMWHSINSLGDFSAGLPDDNDFCMVPDLDAGAIDMPLLPEVPATLDDPDTEDEDESDPGLPEIPASSISYKWSDARWLVSADAQGTQFEAKLTYQQDGCSADYSVLGLYPAIGCESDDDCNDDANGINPDFAVRCEASIGFCVIAESLPAYE